MEHRQLADNGMRQTGGTLTITLSADVKRRATIVPGVPGKGFRTVGRIVGGPTSYIFHGGQKGLSIAVELLSRQGKRRWRKAFLGELARSMRDLVPSPMWIRCVDPQISNI
jgi:hypothetical protein